MNNPIGICFPDFIGLRPLDCLFAQGLAKENTERSEDDFLLTNQAPKGGRLAAKTRQSKTFAG